ncbi:MAG TPA: HD domain-containing phosphohydrolase [Blastocatellia bacterium]|nr:HD domain-containing phosphohydrolase [Blastocatellia bacterium]
MTRDWKRKGDLYQIGVVLAGLLLWVAAALDISINYRLSEQSVFIALALLAVVVGRFIHTFRLPSGLKFTTERVSFSLADAIVLLIACSLGPTPAVFAAGVEGFTSSRRTSKRLSSILFSSSMMSIGAAIAAATLGAVFRYGFDGAKSWGDHELLAVAVAMLAASIAQILTNIALLSTLLALRHNREITYHWKDFLATAPMFFPTSTAATLMYVALQYHLLMLAIIGGPVMLALYFAHRQYRNGVQARITIMEKAHRETIEALAVAINAKDEVTHEHVVRVQTYAAGVARILGCSEQEVEALRAGALLHDIGKIAVPDHIINKPGKLTAAEFDKMKIHTLAGAQILSRVEFPYPVVPVVRSHHERWDGRGYPDGLAGDEIPITARILAVVDCFDAVREDRQYRKAMTRDEAIDLILKGSGTQYDPNVVATFIAHLPEFEAEIRARKDMPLPTFGIEPTEVLSEAARLVPPAAGLAEDDKDESAKATAINRDLKALSAFAQAVLCARAEDDLFKIFVENLRPVVEFDSCAVTVTIPESGCNLVTHAGGEHAELLKGRSVAPGEGVTGWVIANEKPFCNADPRLDLPPQLAERFTDYRTLAVFPVTKGKEMIGAVSLYSSALGEYTATQQEVIQEAVALLASALAARPLSGAQKFARSETGISGEAGDSTGGDLIVTKSGSLKLRDVALESDLPQ